jgi:hypothetical protein
MRLSNNCLTAPWAAATWRWTEWEQAAGQLVNLTSAQLAETTFVPAVNGSDDLVVFATDGERFSSFAQLHIEGPSNNALSAWADLHII